MAEFEDQLNSLLSNPDAMAQIMQLAQSLGGSSPPPAGSPPPEPPPAAFAVVIKSRYTTDMGIKPGSSLASNLSFIFNFSSNNGF